MSARTYGESKNCAGCRFWSEMIARSIGGASVEALCLSSGKLKGQYTFGRMSCESWASGHLGAIDDPYEPPNYTDELKKSGKEEKRT